MRSFDVRGAGSGRRYAADPRSEMKQVDEEATSLGETVNELRYGFITYVSRSGSTLLSRLLNQHPLVCVCTEAHLPKELFGLGSYKGLSFNSEEDLASYLERVKGYSKFSSWGLGLEDILEGIGRHEWPLSGEALLARFLAAYKRKFSPNARIVLYKGPPAMPWELHSMIQAFPGFRIIHLVRDPRAVYASQKRSINPYSGRPFVKSPLETAWQWRRAMLASGRVNSKNLLEVRFEDLVSQPDEALQVICDHLDVDFHSGYFHSDMQSDFSSRLPSSETDLHRRIDQAPDSARVSGWKSDVAPSEVAALESALGTLVLQQRYVPDSKPTGISRFFHVTRMRLMLFRRLVWRGCKVAIGMARFERRYFDKLIGIIRKKR